MEMQEIIRQAEANIRQAVEDYARHTYKTKVLEDISDDFIRKLAEDSSYAKQGLRDLFSRSPVWHPELDALVINGTRTHDPDHQRVRSLAESILAGPLTLESDEKRRLIQNVIWFFAYPDDEFWQHMGIKALNELAPKAYKPGKKPSRVFKALCVALGVADETAGSPFQHLYAQFADELSGRKIDFKLFVSINPAHFLTMSNPKEDERGSCLTSCHSLNSTEYEYNCGCTGYARDEVSFIVFTVADPEDAETLNNRKTTRQVFAYKPGNGILLQSRMYNTAGGTTGEAENSKLYRDLIQREISELESQPNLWRTYESTEGFGKAWIGVGEGFGGYPDWKYSNFGGKVCFRFDHLADGAPCDCEPLEVGTWGLCVMCGDETDEGMYCDYCRPERYVAYCDDCEDGIESEDNVYTVFDSEGTERTVCERCLNNNYTQCDHCGEYHANSVMERVDGLDVCPQCLEERYTTCENCGDYCKHDEMYLVTDQDGQEIRVCGYCRSNGYETCDECGELVHYSRMCDAHDVCGDEVRVCQDCYERHDYARFEAENDADMEEAV